MTGPTYSWEAELEPAARRAMLDIFTEFGERISYTAAMYADSIAGYALLTEKLDSYQARYRQQFPGAETLAGASYDECHFTHKMVVDKPFLVNGLVAPLTQGDLRRRLAENGPNQDALGYQAIVFLYAYWEDNLRSRIAKAIGCEKSAVTSDFWGEVRHLRNSILHNKGRASKELAGCRIINWFNVDDRIVLDEARMRELFVNMLHTRNDLHNWSLPKPKFKIDPNW